MSAPANEPTMTPARSSTRGSSRRPETTLSRYTSATAPVAPMNAASGTAQGQSGFMAIASDGAEAGAAGEPEEVRIGERVPEQRLERGAGDAEAAADQERQQDAGDAELAHDRRVRRAGVHQSVPHGGRCERDRPGEDADENARRDNAREEQRRAAPPTGRAHRPAAASAAPSRRIASGARGLGRLNSEPTA